VQTLCVHKYPCNRRGQRTGNPICPLSAARTKVLAGSGFGWCPGELEGEDVSMWPGKVREGGQCPVRVPQDGGEYTVSTRPLLCAAGPHALVPLQLWLLPLCFSLRVTRTFHSGADPLVALLCPSIVLGIIRRALGIISSSCFSSHFRQRYGVLLAGGFPLERPCRRAGSRWYYPRAFVVALGMSAHMPRSRRANRDRAPLLPCVVPGPFVSDCVTRDSQLISHEEDSCSTPHRH
jgi:hypothetical protein